MMRDRVGIVVVTTSLAAIMLLSLLVSSWIMVRFSLPSCP